MQTLKTILGIWVNWLCWGLSLFLLGAAALGYYAGLTKDPQFYENALRCTFFGLLVLPPVRQAMAPVVNHRWFKAAKTLVIASIILFFGLSYFALDYLAPGSPSTPTTLYLTENKDALANRISTADLEEGHRYLVYGNVKAFSEVVPGVPPWLVSRGNIMIGQGNQINIVDKEFQKSETWYKVEIPTPQGAVQGWIPSDELAGQNLSMEDSETP